MSLIVNKENEDITTSAESIFMRRFWRVRWIRSVLRVVTRDILVYFKSLKSSMLRETLKAIASSQCDRSLVELVVFLINAIDNKKCRLEVILRLCFEQRTYRRKHLDHLKIESVSHESTQNTYVTYYTHPQTCLHLCRARHIFLPHVFFCYTYSESRTFQKILQERNE